MSYKLTKQQAISMEDLSGSGGTELRGGKSGSGSGSGSGLNVGISLRNKWLVTAKVTLPLFGFIFSIFWAIVQEPTRMVQCSGEDDEALNFLPTVSQATGNLYVSNLVWKFCITVSTVLNLFYGLLEVNRLKLVVNKKFQLLVLACLVLRVVWATGVLGLSYVSSSENLLVHSLFLALFLIFSNFFMICNCYVLFKCRNIPPRSELEEQSRRWKLRLMLLSVVVTPLLPYFYVRHMTSCEDFVYSVFAFLEYVIVLATTAYMSLAFYDYSDLVFEIALVTRNS